MAAILTPRGIFTPRGSDSVTRRRSGSSCGLRPMIPGIVPRARKSVAWPQIGERSKSLGSNSPGNSPGAPLYHSLAAPTPCNVRSGPNTCVAGGIEATSSSAKATGKTGLIIWFHYLGGKGADWEKCLKSKIANQLPWVEWYFPDAPQRPVTNYDGAMVHAWFDQLEGKVTEHMGTPGLQESTSMVHAMIRQAEARGIPANRIMLGGMSQGGVLAMSAGFSYERPLAGIIAVSAWVPSNLATMIRHPSTPLFLGNGECDEVVPLEVFLRGANMLAASGCTGIVKKQYSGLTHTFADYEKDDVKCFVMSALPNSTNLTQMHSSAVIARIPTPLRLL